MTKWRIDFSNEAEKFLIRNKLTEQTVIKKIILIDWRGRAYK